MADNLLPFSSLLAAFRATLMHSWSQPSQRTLMICCRWLSHLQHQLTGARDSFTISPQLVCAVAAMLVLHRTQEVSQQALSVIVRIAQLDKAKAPLFLPLLLYCLRNETVPETRLLILEHIPKLAQHKFCIAPVLKTIQALMTSPKLQPVAIRLMTSLWEVQDRCFPQLLKAIGEDESASAKSSPQSSSALAPEVLLAKAAAVRDICRLKPEQHGADMLAPLSAILQTATGEEGAPASAMALEALYHLCEAEVIDIQSAWGVLGKQLSNDRRGIVIQKVCELFSLVPSLAVNTPEYEKFQRECVTSLWLYTSSVDPLVQGAAFQALASYTLDCFHVSHLPRQVCEELHQQMEVMRQQQGEEANTLDIDTVFPIIPGICFTRLLRSLPPAVLEDFEGFLSSMVGKEVDNMPRGIHHSAVRRQGASSNQDKALASIPSFLATQYEKTKQPGLRPSLAAALLFCHDPLVEVGRDGKPRKHYLVRHGKQFLDTFKTLLQEIPVQPSEWHRTMLMPQAWVSFIGRLFHALTESRKAELELQLKHSQISDDQLSEKSNTAWLFARDSIVEVLKAASRGNPSQQANVVLSLAGVIVSTSQFAASLDADVLKECDTATEHLSHSHWLNVAMDTILSLRDVTYQPRGKLLGLCQQRSADDRVAASMLTQASAGLSLACVVPSLISSHGDLVLFIVKELTLSLPGGRKAPESSALLFHTGLGLGMVLGRLFEEHFSDIAHEKDAMEVWKSLGVLEKCCFNTSMDNRAGCLLGLGFALTGLCSEGKTDSRAHVTSTHDKLMRLLEQTAPDHHSYQALWVCLACVAGTAFGANVLSVEQVTGTVHQLEASHQQHPQVTGVSLALGMLCYSLSRMGHPGVAGLRQALTATWLRTLTSDSPPLDKVAALNGLLALIGSEQTLIVVQAGVSLTSSDVKVSEVIQVVTQIVKADPDLGIQCNAAWMLGHLSLSASAVAENRTSVPSNYSYLPESSFLRAIVDLLLEAGKQGPEFVSQKVVQVALIALQDDVRHGLPPLNWAGILSPLMRMQFGLECQRLCLELAVAQSATCPTAAMLLSSWLTPPLVLTLDERCKRALYRSLPRLIKVLPLSVLTAYLEQACVRALATCSPATARHALQGLAAALRVPDPPEAVMSSLFQTAGRMYSLLPDHFLPSLYGSMAECLAAVPDDIFDSITADDYTTGACSLKGFYIGCYLVTAGSQPITLLNGLIDSAMNNPQCSQDSLLHVLCHCLWGLVACPVDTSGPMARLGWLVELLGHTRNIATRALPLTSQTQSLGKVTEFAVTVVAMALGLLTNSQPSPDFGLDPGLLNVKASEETESEGPRAVPGWSGALRETFLQQLPVAVLRFQQTPWDQILPKVFDWLLTMSQLPDDVLPPHYRRTCTASMLMLRHSSEFRKTATWTRVLA